VVTKTARGHGVNCADRRRRGTPATRPHAVGRAVSFTYTKRAISCRPATCVRLLSRAGVVLTTSRRTETSKWGEVGRACGWDGRANGENIWPGGHPLVTPHTAVGCNALPILRTFDVASSFSLGHTQLMTHINRDEQR
jgi:hypothetical protein